MKGKNTKTPKGRMFDDKSDSKSIGIGIGNDDTGPVFTWNQMVSKTCSIAHLYKEAPNCKAEKK